MDFKTVGSFEEGLILKLPIPPRFLFIEKSDLSWYGHVMRMGEIRQPVGHYKWTPEGKRHAGRLRKQWKDVPQDAVITRVETLEHVEETELWENRKEWRKFMRHHN